MTPQAETGVAAFVKHKVAGLSFNNRSRAQIARAAGFETEETLLKIETGQIKLPLDRAIALANALDEDPRPFVFLALGQFAPTDLVDLLIDDPELNALRTEAQAALLATQVEVAIIGAHTKTISESALAALKAATEITRRQEAVMRALENLRDAAGDAREPRNTDV